MIDQYEYDNTIYEIKNYHNNDSAFFKTYQKCAISDLLKKGMIWEPHLHKIFDQYVTKDSVVIEGGCHVGAHAIKLAKICRTIYCFEPFIYSYYLLNHNLCINNISNCIVSQYGLSNEAKLQYYDWVTHGNPGGAALAHDGSMKTSFCGQLITIDSLNLEKIDFIKLDIENYEILAILGGFNLIKKYKPVIVLESWKNHKGEIDYEYTKNVFQILLDIGYKIKQIKGPDFLFLP